MNTFTCAQHHYDDETRQHGCPDCYAEWLKAEPARPLELEGLQHWSGWAVQYPGKLPTIYGDKSIAALNCYPDEGGELLHLVTIHRGTV